MRHHATVRSRTAPLLVVVCLLAAGAAGAQTHFGPITVEGNSVTASSLILHELPFAEGDAFSFELLDKAWEHLEDLGWFAYVDLEYDDLGGDVVPVHVVVEEDRTTRWYPIIDYDPRWDLLLGLRVYDINFRGRGEKLSTSATWYKRHGYELGWSHPWLFGVRGLSWGVDAVWEDADFEYLDFDFRRLEGGGRLRWDFRSPFFVETGLSARAFEQKSPTSLLPAAVGAGKRNSLIWRGTVGMDTRDILWYPTRGVFNRLQVEIVDRPAFYDSNTLLTADLRAFVPLPWEHILALRAWGRRVDGPLWPEDLLFWGGAETIRGYQYGSLAGEEGFLLTAEYRLPLFLMTISGDGRVVGLGLHAFADAGSNWWEDETRDTLFSWGGGAHINVSDHQFRFEIAVTEDGDTSFQFLDAFNF
jgi:outer membrane protein assembly factor BamA